MLLRYGYILFISILLATFVGVGIAAFYKGPKMPEYPSRLNVAPLEAPEKLEEDRNRQIAEQEQYDRELREYQQKNEEYNKNVSIIALVAAVAFVLAGLVLARNILLISDGLLLGGIFTLVYSIIRGFGANDDIFRFLVVSAGLFIALVIGYIKFVKASLAKM